MNTLKEIFLAAWDVVSLGSLRARKRQAKRRANYEFLKAKISERHFAGFAGLTVDFKGHRFDKLDMACFKPPMYGVVQNIEGQWCIFWDRSRLTREIGTGAPLQEGEVLVSDSKIRTKPDATIETIDEQKPLTVQVPPSETEVANAPEKSDAAAV